MSWVALRVVTFLQILRNESFHKTGADWLGNTVFEEECDNTTAYENVHSVISQMDFSQLCWTNTQWEKKYPHFWGLIGFQA
jgi:hypothetical protein